ncbi:MAG: hypothetical protein ACRDPM_02000 [Solirubrobacteraceae bacterium]
MLVVLIAGARNGRRRPGLADSVNLIANALLMRVRLRAPRSNPTVFWAVRLMVLGAVLELAALVTVVSTRGHLAAAIARHYPAMPLAHVHHLVNVRVLEIAVGAPLAAGVWLWLAWSNDRGRGRARSLFGALFALTSVSLFAAIGQDAVTLAPADLIAGGALWIVALVALLLITSQGSGGHYGGRGDARDGRNARPVLPVTASCN